MRIDPGHTWAIDDVGNVVQLEVPTGCVRARCPRHHAAVIVRTRLDKPCHAGGERACLLPMVEISQDTYDRMIGRARRLAASGLVGECEDLDRRDFTAEGITRALGLVQPPLVVAN